MRRMSLCFALFGLLAPAALAGQACLGSHATPGSASLVGSVAVSSGDVAFGPSAAVNLPGPMFGGAGYARSQVDVPDLSGNEIALGFGAEALNDQGTSLCVSGRAGRTWIGGLPEGTSVKGEAIWGGASVGRSFGQDFLITPFGFVGVAAVDASASVFDVEIAEGEDVAARFEAGVGIGSEALQARPWISYMTFGGADPAFGLDVLATF